MTRHTLPAMSRCLLAAAALALPLGVCGCKESKEPGTATTPAAAAAPATQPVSEWKTLFDGRTLSGWKVADFGGHGEVNVADGSIILPMGAALTGIVWEGDVPYKMNYEISLEAQRVNGSDFFCGLTFPVNDTAASLILGGWGGDLCGISSLDDYDASSNETTTLRSFQQGKWYKVRVRVLPFKFQAWLDDTKIVDVRTKNRKISTRAEIDLCRPLGIATWQTTGAVRNIRIRPLRLEEIPVDTEEEQ